MNLKCSLFVVCFWVGTRDLFEQNKWSHTLCHKNLIVKIKTDSAIIKATYCLWFLTRVVWSCSILWMRTTPTKRSSSPTTRRRQSLQITLLKQLHARYRSISKRLFWPILFRTCRFPVMSHLCGEESPRQRETCDVRIRELHHAAGPSG